MLPALTQEAVAEALRWRAVTAGWFDPTVGAAVSAWQQGRMPVLQAERQVALDGAGQLPRFLYQYRGKTIQDPIQTHRDIVNLSGATISVPALNRGVKKVLYFVTTYY